MLPLRPSPRSLPRWSIIHMNLFLHETVISTDTE
jgi:hypothetical protein